MPPADRCRRSQSCRRARTTCSRSTKRKPDDAKALIAVGESKADAKLDPAATRRLDDGLQPDDESRRSAEQVSSKLHHCHASLHPSSHESPSDACFKPAASSSPAARICSAARRWPRSLGEALRAAGDGRVQRHQAAGPAFPAQGQARDLPAHGRRPVADGPVRLQAGDERMV